MATKDYWSTEPEKEYTVHDDCYPCCSGGGHQKIRLYKDDIAFEQTCGSCPLALLGTCGADLCCLFCIFSNTKSITRRPYRELKGVYLDQSKGCCPGNKYYIDGLFGIHGRTPGVAMKMSDQTKSEEMCGDITKRMNEARQYGPESMQRM